MFLCFSCSFALVLLICSFGTLGFFVSLQVLAFGEFILGLVWQTGLLWDFSLFSDCGLLD